MAFERTIQRYNRGSLTKDLFYYLSNEDQAETESPPRHIVISDGLIALIAGSDTTATTLSNVFYCLLTHPETYKRLQDEVDKYYPLGEDALNPEHHVHMTYLDAVINETMRLFPAVSSGSLRAPIRGTGGKTVGPYYLPEGTQARLHVYSLQRDARYFTQPESFWPDRWLIAEGLQKFSGQFVHDPNAFIPFSFGTANCVGKNLAMLEMRMVMCNCMQKLEMNFAEGWDSEMWLRDLEDVFVTRMGQLPVTIRKRE
ncbi:hypothetical protein PHLCEN_2v13299 [Hermanssonia centrifuga]|nr:hypothetical protein PHLCEN_2v13299 [Hermanssonia centrifuga]